MESLTLLQFVQSDSEERLNVEYSCIFLDLTGIAIFFYHYFEGTARIKVLRFKVGGM